MKGRSRRLGKVAALGAATLLLSSNSFRALSQEPKIGSVSVKPVGTSSKDPNLGEWFVLKLERGETAKGTALITNIDDVAQHLRLHLADLTFTRNGSAQVNDGDQKDVGAWGRFLVPDITVGPRASAEAVFEITAPLGAEPGDHIGVVMATSDPDPGNLTFVLRSATRLYVTVPGEAKKAFEIDDFAFDLDSWFFPKEAVATVILQNTGRIRLQPKVTVRDTPAEGADVLLSQSRERYIADVKIPWYGGLTKMPIVARSEGGLIRRVNASKFVFPFALILGLGFAALVAWLGRRWWRTRGSRLAALHADIRRLETLVVQRPAGASGVPGSVEEAAQGDEMDEVQALLAGLKRARRIQSQESLERLALALHRTGTNSLEYLEEALKKAAPGAATEIREAIRTYDHPDAEIQLAPKIPKAPAPRNKKPPVKLPPKRSKGRTVPKSRVKLSPPENEITDDKRSG